MERRLAAILATDVVGYSRLMEADEAGTLARLKSLRDGLLHPTIAEHHGRIVKLMGDGTLVEFASAVDAVRCAITLQQDVAVREADAPEGGRLVFRMGVNFGNVIVEEDDIYGDGVNVAARLEGMADPGGVLISQSFRSLGRRARVSAPRDSSSAVSRRYQLVAICRDDAPCRRAGLTFVATTLGLLGQHLSRAAEVGRQILEFRQAVLHGDHLVLVIHVHRRLVNEAPVIGSHRHPRASGCR